MFDEKTKFHKNLYMMIQLRCLTGKPQTGSITFHNSLTFLKSAAERNRLKQKYITNFTLSSEKMRIILAKNFKKL